MFIITGSEIWRDSFLLKQNVFTYLQIASIDCFLAFKFSVRWSVKSFPKSALSSFCRNAAFSVNIEANCDEEIPVTPSNTFFFLSQVIVLLYCPINLFIPCCLNSPVQP